MRVNCGHNVGRRWVNIRRDTTLGHPPERHSAHAYEFSMENVQDQQSRLERLLGEPNNNPLRIFTNTLQMALTTCQPKLGGLRTHCANLFSYRTLQNLSGVNLGYKLHPS